MLKYLSCLKVNLGVPLWLCGCHCCGLGQIPGPETSTCPGRAPPPKNSCCLDQVLKTQSSPCNSPSQKVQESGQLRLANPQISVVVCVCVCVCVCV